MVIISNFVFWVDGVVMVDFIREEDGYNFEFYGLMILCDCLVERLFKVEV